VRRGRLYTYRYTVNDSCINMGSDDSHFNVPVGSDGQSRKTVSTNHNLFEERGEPKRYRTEVLPLTSLTPYRKAKPAHRTAEHSAVGFVVVVVCPHLLSRSTIRTRTMPSVNDGRCHKYHFTFVETERCLSRQNTSFVATKECLPLYTNTCLSRQTFCRDKHTL